jgi:hypothetical protein
MSTQMNESTEFRQIAKDLQLENPEIDGVALVSSDGRIIGHHWNNGTEPDKIGAVGAALLGLGKKAIQVLSSGQFLQVVLQSTGGTLAIYGAGEKAVLIVSTCKDGNLGMLNLCCRLGAARLATLIDEDQC